MWNCNIYNYLSHWLCTTNESHAVTELGNWKQIGDKDMYIHTQGAGNKINRKIWTPFKQDSGFTVVYLPCHFCLTIHKYGFKWLLAHHHWHKQLVYLNRSTPPCGIIIIMVQNRNNVRITRWHNEWIKEQITLVTNKPQREFIATTASKNQTELHCASVLHTAVEAIRTRKCYASPNSYRFKGSNRYHLKTVQTANGSGNRGSGFKLA